MAQLSHWIPTVFIILPASIALLANWGQSSVNTRWVSGIAFCCLVLGALFNAHQVKKAAAMQAEQFSLMQAAQRKEAEAQDKVYKLSQSLADKSDQLARFSAQTADFLIGGDSVPEVIPISIASKPMLILGNLGKNPIYDVSTRVCDEDLMFNNPSDPLESKACFSDFLPEVGPNTSFPLSSAFQPHDKSLNLNVFFYARNGSFQECLRIRYGTKWEFAYKITHPGSVKVLKQHIPEGFEARYPGVKWN